MTEFFQRLAEFASQTTIWVYLFIFFGKLTEVSVSTLRIVLINRGIRIVGAMIAVLEIILWLVVTSTVLANFQSDPFKVLVYALAFGAGNYLGSWLDERLAFGLSSIQVVVQDMESAQCLSAAMREHGYGITAMDVQGIDGKPHYMLVTMIRRKLLKDALALINDVCGCAVITVSDVKVQKGGYMRNSPTRRIDQILKWVRK